MTHCSKHSSVCLTKLNYVVSSHLRVNVNSRKYFSSKSRIPCFNFRIYQFIDNVFWYYNLYSIEVKIYNFEGMFWLGGQIADMNTLLHCNFCFQIIGHQFLSSKVSPPPRPNSLFDMIKCTFIITFLFPCEYSIRPKLLYCLVTIVGYFHGNQSCITSCYHLYTWGYYRKWVP